jgi:hypothetical protein
VICRGGFAQPQVCLEICSDRANRAAGLTALRCRPLPDERAIASLRLSDAIAEILLRRCGDNVAVTLRTGCADTAAAGTHQNILVLIGKRGRTAVEEAVLLIPACASLQVDGPTDERGFATIAPILERMTPAVVNISVVPARSPWPNDRHNGGR